MAEVDGSSSIFYFNYQRQPRDQSCRIFLLHVMWLGMTEISDIFFVRFGKERKRYFNPCRFQREQKPYFCQKTINIGIFVDILAYLEEKYHANIWQNLTISG